MSKYNLTLESKQQVCCLHNLHSLHSD